MDAVLPLVAIAAMLALGAIAFLLLSRMLGTIRDLRGVTTGLNDTMRWAIGQVVTDPTAAHAGDLPDRTPSQ